MHLCRKTESPGPRVSRAARLSRNVFLCHAWDDRERAPSRLHLDGANCDELIGRYLELEVTACIHSQEDSVPSGFPARYDLHRKTALVTRVQISLRP